MSNQKEITVYSQDDCIACDRTKKFLDKNQIAYKIIDMTGNDEIKDHIKNNLGLFAAPVVLINDGEEKWAGYNREKLTSLV